VAGTAVARAQVPAAAPPAAAHDRHILDAPPGIDRWEPSGAAVIPGETRLWVVNDKAPVLAAYSLPLVPGHNTPVYHAVMTRTIDRVKFEAVRYHPRHGLLLLEAIRRGVLAGVKIAPDGEPLFDFDLKGMDVPPDALDGVATGPFEFVAVEALGVVGEQVLTGTRGFKPAAKSEQLRPRAVVFDATGRGTKPMVLSVGGRDYGLSDLVCPPGLPDRCFQTWSFENENGDDLRDVAGLLAVAPLVDGLPGPPRVCKSFAAKPEGVTRFRDTLIVVFDDDLRRKRPGDPARFPIEANQDFAATIPLSECPL
jgi:hypothetical protein